VVLTAAFLLGLVAGLRSMMQLAAVSLAADSGRLVLANGAFSFLRYPASAWIFSIFAAGELIADKLPVVPSRKQVFPFAVRILSGAIAGGAVGASAGAPTLGIALGVVGAILGTIGGFAFRARLATALNRDLPAALLEDAVAILLALAAYRLMPARPLL
jgi:uncharacterized membrane protein